MMSYTMSIWGAFFVRWIRRYDVNPRDRAFLYELTQFTHKNHIASAYIYRTRLNSPELLEDVAVFAGDQLRHYASREEAVADVRAHGEAKAIERIICAKIFAEFVSACEDLGALGDAIRNRARNGVFLRYMSSGTAEAASFFDHVLSYDVLNDPSMTVGTLLSLPDSAVLANSFSPEDYVEVQQSFRNQAINLYATAVMYRDRVGAQVRTATGSAPLPAQADEMYILLDIRQAASASTQRGGIQARAFNKIKHRFMLTDQLNDYALVGAADTIEYAVLRPEVIDAFFESISAIAGTMAELAAFLLHLDTAGVSL
jgi:hypothetical protein